MVVVAVVVVVLVLFVIYACLKGRLMTVKVVTVDLKVTSKVVVRRTSHTTGLN